MRKLFYGPQTAPTAGVNETIQQDLPHLIDERDWKMRCRSKSGQSLVEYALGIGCVCAVCMVALASLGDICGDIFLSVGNAINYRGGKPGDIAPIVSRSATPWNLQ